MIVAFLVYASVSFLPLTDEVFLADADIRREEPQLVQGKVLWAACTVRDSETPSYRLSYADPGDANGTLLPVDVCAWRPWRVGTFMVVEDCACHEYARESDSRLR